MLINALQKLTNLSQSRRYWLINITGGLFLLFVALFYEYYLEELPCVLCIHVRLWVSLLIIAGCFGMYCREHRIANLVAHLSIVLVAVGLVERSYQLLGTERGFVFGDCGFNLGMPSWFAIDEWLPWLFRVETSCGYTPEIMFGVTMAEALMLISVCLLITSISVFIAYLIKIKADTK